MYLRLSVKSHVLYTVYQRVEIPKLSADLQLAPPSSLTSATFSFLAVQFFFYMMCNDCVKELDSDARCFRVHPKFKAPNAVLCLIDRPVARGTWGGGASHLHLKNTASAKRAFHQPTL